MPHYQKHAAPERSSIEGNGATSSIPYIANMEEDWSLHLGRVEDPQSLPRITKSRPDRECPFVIVGGYDEQPQSGIGPYVWCCECQKDNHWRGYVVADALLHRYTIGGICGVKHFGGHRFAIARRSFEDIEKREGLLRRRRALLDAKAAVEAEVAALTISDGLQAIESTRAKLRRASANMLSRLNSRVIAGGELTTNKPARFGRRYAEMNISIGRLEGAALIHSELRSAVTGLKTEMAALEESTEAQVETMDSHRLTEFIRPAERAIDRLIAERDRLRGVPAFFSARNIRRLASWSRPMHNWYRLEAGEDRTLIVWDVTNGTTLVDPVTNISFPELPTCENLAKANSVTR